jgi:hypothetical protein
MMAQDRYGWSPLLAVRDSIVTLSRNVRTLTRQRRRHTADTGNSHHRYLVNGMNPGLVQSFTTGLHRVHEHM